MQIPDLNFLYDGFAAGRSLRQLLQKWIASGAIAQGTVDFLNVLNAEQPGGAG